jgi:hypothetical protein
MENNNRKSKVAILGAVLSIVSLIVGIVSIYGYREQWWRHLEAFDIFGWATYIAIFAILLLIVSIIRKKSVVLSMFATLFSLPILLSAFLFNYTPTLYPPINDITTDTKNPPSYWDMPSPMEYAGEEIAKLQQEAYPDLVTTIINKPLEDVFNKALHIVQDNDWELISKDVEEGRIEAVASSLFFGFKDEVVIRITKVDEGVAVDLRSRSRLGKIDRGVNAKRIRKFLNKLTN